jgi:hypothetical protein
MLRMRLPSHVHAVCSLHGFLSSSRQDASDPRSRLLVQEYVIDIDGRNQVGGTTYIGQNQGGGFLGNEPDDYSTSDAFFNFNPDPTIGNHELECYALAYSSDLNPSPISTASVSVPFTGDAWAACPGPQHM